MVAATAADAERGQESERQQPLEARGQGGGHGGGGIVHERGGERAFAPEPGRFVAQPRGGLL